MEREYDLFEHFPNGKVLWRMSSARENAVELLRELAAINVQRGSLSSFADIGRHR